MDEQTRRMRTCENKPRYETEAVAQDAAVRLMAGRATRPLYVYPCPYCLGFHLTSNGHGKKPVQPLLHAEPDLQHAVLFLPHEAPCRGKRRRAAQTGRRAGLRRHLREREQAGESALDLLPRPQVASPEQAAAFFAGPGCVTPA